MKAVSSFLTHIIWCSIQLPHGGRWGCSWSPSRFPPPPKKANRKSEKTRGKEGEVELSHCNVSVLLLAVSISYWTSGDKHNNLPREITLQPKMLLWKTAVLLNSTSQLLLIRMLFFFFFYAASSIRVSSGMKV